MKLLNEMCEINIGKTPARSNEEYWNGEHRWLAISDLKDKYIVNSKEGITAKAIKECNMKLIPKDTVVMSFKLSIGKTAILKEAMYSNEAIASFVIKNSEELIPEFLYYALKTINFQRFADKAAKGITLNKKKLNLIEIPYIDVESQRKIIRVLEIAEKLIECRQAQISSLDELIQSVFLEMFGDPRKNSKHLNEIPLTELLIGIKGGGTPSKKNEEFYKNGTIPWVTPKDMKVLYIDKSKIYITEEAVERSSANYIQEGSLLMVIRSGILKRYLPIAINRKKVTLNQDMKALIPNDKSIKVEYLYTFFKLYQDVLLNKVRSVTADNLDFDDVKNINVPVPEIEEQITFKEKFDEIQRNKVNLESQKAGFENLYNALLHKAFKGEILNILH